MTYVFDPKRGAVVPILVMERETIAAETNIRTVMQRRGLADGLKIQHLCTRFANLVRNTVDKSCDYGKKNLLTITIPSFIALETRLRYEISLEQEFCRLQEIILEKENDLAERQLRALKFTVGDGVALLPRQ